MLTHKRIAFDSDKENLRLYNTKIAKAPSQRPFQFIRRAYWISLAYIEIYENEAKLVIFLMRSRLLLEKGLPKAFSEHALSLQFQN